MFNPLKLMHPHYRFRDAGTGKFVTRLYAALHPGTTVSERVPRDEGDLL